MTESIREERRLKNVRNLGFRFSALVSLSLKFWTGLREFGLGLDIRDGSGFSVSIRPIPIRPVYFNSGSGRVGTT